MTPKTKLTSAAAELSLLDHSEETVTGQTMTSSFENGDIRMEQISNAMIAVAEESQCDHSESSDGEDTVTGKTAASSSDSEDVNRDFIKNEEEAVIRARRSVGVGFVICAATVSIAVLIFAVRSDERAFEVEYDGFVKEIMDLVQWEVRYNFALMAQLSASITISSRVAGSTFPFHTETDYEITGGFVDGMGGIMAAAYAPLVKAEEIDQWEEYANANQDWVENSKYLEQANALHRDALHGTIQDHEHNRRLQSNETESISKEIFRWENGEKVIESSQPGQILAPLWQVSPADYSAVNANLLSDSRIADLYETMVKADHAVMSSSTEIKDVFDFLFEPEGVMGRERGWDPEGQPEPKRQKRFPHAFILAPVYKEFKENNAETVGFVIGVTPFSNLLNRMLPEGKGGIIAVFHDTCGNTMSFEMTSDKATFLGNKDVHETKFDEYERYASNLEMYEEQIEGLCGHDIHIYPSTKLRNTYDTNKPLLYSGVVIISFMVTAAMFIFYDCMVNARQHKTMAAAARTQAIVTSLFPKEMGKKMMEDAYNTPDAAPDNTAKKGGKPGLQSIMGANGKIYRYANSSKTSRPLAELFPEATIMFGDLVGFSAWSSMREPSQVFMLLEGLYSGYDELALKRKVFKVETIGDCYVAACGVPDVRKDHAVVMVRFARDCLDAMHLILNELTVDLGPDTTDLGMRVGLHSGPVTAGVLRGDRARFQLFGDTVNTTARLESSGIKNHIHVSQETANLLTAARKEHWLTARESRVDAKGKGLMQTYWVYAEGDTDKSTASTTFSASNSISSGNSRELRRNSYHTGKVIPAYHLGKVIPVVSKSTNRNVDWTVEILMGFLKEVEARRQSIGANKDSLETIKVAERQIQDANGVPFDEIEEFFHLPKYSASKAVVDPNAVVINSIVTAQLRDFVQCIAQTYHANSFHNFDHANHVMLSVVKLLKRIVAPTQNEQNKDDEAMHDYTFGITSDPLTQFSVALSALVHDIDHSGVPNSRLSQEQDRLAQIYRGKSIAEQNSVDIAWGLLMDERFDALRMVIYSTVDDLKRFRQMMVHTVLATDIMDRTLSLERKERWSVTFGLGGDKSAGVDNEVDRKATIVIEHLMQASDVAHTMQHWHVYQKWNARLFNELYGAFKEGRSETDPTEGWYKGEMGFFDFYVIPLAQKLKSCGVFGVSSDEYLTYARQNRAEWEEKGEDLVKKLVLDAEQRFLDPDAGS